ncbi:activating transcription factor 7 interacting protein 2 isoform X2 [Centroberyx gerrardi]
MKMGINGTQDNTQKKSPLLSPVVPVKLEISGSDTEDEVTETMSHMGKNTMEVNEELVGTMKATKKSLKKMRADKEALKAAIADLSKEPPPPSLRRCDSPVSPPCKRPFMVIDQESADHQEEVEEQKADRVKVEHLPGDSSPKHTDSEKDGLKYPPLPSTPFPSILSMQAASYNIPQRLTLQLALIRNPPGLSVFWNVEEEEPSAPPMDSYSIFMTVEKVKGSGVFPEWKSLGEVTAIPLPMCVIISKYEPGYKACFAVVGKDKFGRYGPYSRVVPATIPD